MMQRKGGGWSGRTPRCVFCCFGLMLSAGIMGTTLFFFCFVFGDVLVWVSSLGHGIEKKRELPSGLSGVCLPAHQIKKKVAQNASEIRVM